mmetsp:Transcript_62108/g.74732  ORF Transcript_62108/g.74732 Transcript_62108/m.74732 type:complete len:119 (-) Transcript_62108:131-487(-)
MIGSTSKVSISSMVGIASIGSMENGGDSGGDADACASSIGSSTLPADICRMEDDLRVTGWIANPVQTNAWIEVDTNSPIAATATGILFRDIILLYHKSIKSQGDNNKRNLDEDVEGGV